MGAMEATVVRLLAKSDGSMHGAWAWISAECGTEKMAYRVISIGETSKKNGVSRVSPTEFDAVIAWRKVKKKHRA